MQCASIGSRQPVIRCAPRNGSVAMAHNDFAADRRLLTPARYERWTASWVTRQRRQEKVAWGQRRRGWGSECCDSHSHTLRCHLCDGEMLHHSLCAHCTAHHTRGVIVTHSLTQVGSRGSGQNIQQLCCLVRVSWFSFGLPQPSEEKCHVITTPEKKPCPDVTGCVTSS